MWRRATGLVALVLLCFAPVVVPVSNAGPPSCTLASQGKSTSASTSEAAAGRIPSYAVDGNAGTRWASSQRGTQWLQVDLGSVLPLCKVHLNWEASFAVAYQVQVSHDGTTWSDAYATTGGAVGTRDVPVDATGRYVRMLATAPGSPWNYSLWEFQVFATDPAPPAPLTPLTVSGRTLTRGGQPFFWLGDAAWTLPAKLNRADTKSYLDTRQSQGFTVVQAAAVTAIADPNEQGDLPFGNNNPATPATTPGANPANVGEYDYWDHLDHLVTEASRRGLQAALAPVWADLVVNGVVNRDNAKPYGQFLGQRYGDDNVVWVLGGDRTGQGYQTVWQRLAEGIELGSGKAELVTYHPPAGEVFDAPWIDFLMVHNGQCPAVPNPVAAAYSSTTKPVIDGEGLLDNAPLCGAASPSGHSDERDVRRQAWTDVFAGAFGHGYGHNSVWQFHSPGQSGLNEARSYWRDAVNEPAAWQLRHLRALLDARPGVRLPDAAHTTAIREQAGGYLLMYVAGNSPLTVNLDTLSGATATSAWFNPRTGAVTANGNTPSDGTRQFTAPTNEDWVLVLDDTARGYGVPAVATTPPATSAPNGCLLASQGKPASASSSEEGTGRVPANAVDGNPGSRWATTGRGTEWFQVDLGAPMPLCKILINWDNGYASGYKLETSNDQQNWTALNITSSGATGIREVPVTGTGRYVRVLATSPGSQWGYSLWEFQAYTVGPTTAVAPIACATRQRVLSVGDSITDGYDVPGGYRTALWDRITGSGREVEFVGGLQNGPASLPDRDHEGHTGWQLSQVDAAVTAWLRNTRPDAVLLHIGTVDIEQEVDLANAATRLGLLLDRIAAVAPNATTYVSNLIPADHLYYFEELAAPYNAAVPQLVAARQAKGQRIVFVDQHAALTTGDLGDGMHPTAAGHAKMADRWFDALYQGCPPPTARSAATRYGWGTPAYAAEFNGTALDSGWVANGPWPGPNNKGRVLPEQVRVGGGAATITGLANGDTGMISRSPGLYRGRWEARVRLPAGCECYRSALTLWPDANDHPAGGEVVFLEVFDTGRQTASFFLHHPSERLSDQRQLDMTMWNNVAVEWTGSQITGYLNGEVWFQTTRSNLFPPRVMHPTIKLGWNQTSNVIPTGASMDLDWVREYRL